MSDTIDKVALKELRDRTLDAIEKANVKMYKIFKLDIPEADKDIAGDIRDEEVGVARSQFDMEYKLLLAAIETHYLVIKGNVIIEKIMMTLSQRDAYLVPDGATITSINVEWYNKVSVGDNNA